MTTLLPHTVTWVSAAPLWKSSLKPEALRRPAILGFGSDRFMDDLLADLARQPASISARVATGPSPSYRDRQPFESYDDQPLTASLKLYQPAHGWFYLVAGSLVCQVPGLPDHSVDLGAGEQAGFVVRRRDPSAGELALVVGADGSKTWQPAAGVSLAADEELLPLFPLGFADGDKRRRLMAGMIPAASQDALQSAPVGTPAPSPTAKPAPVDALEEVKGRVTNALKVLIQSPNPDPPLLPPDDQLPQQTSYFILVDLADFLSQYIPDALSALKDGSNRAGQTGALVTFLRSLTVQGQSFVTLMLAALALPAGASFSGNLALLDGGTTNLATFDARLQAALEEATGTDIGSIKPVAQQVGATTYVVRLVYRRPACSAFKPDVVSAPSEPFVLASYFDPDAPGRPIRISMPFDPSIAGLRKFRKSVKLVLSDALRKKVKGIGKINDSVSGPGFDCGGFSLSIPIITICAMIILFIFLNLLNLIFWWLPFVKICFPTIEVEP